MENLSGRTYGVLSVLSLSHMGKKRESYWVCLCVCGGTKVTRRSRLLGGIGTSRCLHKRASLVAPGVKTKTARAWSSMKSRCNNTNDVRYKYYGGRGVSVCKEWNESFQNFLRDMGEAPEGLSLERIDNNLGYFKENCRWATKAEQNRNTRRAIIIEVEGVRKCAAEWAVSFGINQNTFRNWIKMFGKYAAISRAKEMWRLRTI